MKIRLNKIFTPFASLLLVFTLFISSCVKHGCTDERALNWDYKANKADISSCIYTYTPYIGKWLMSDTIESSSPTYYRQDTVTVAAIDTSTTLLNITLYNGATVGAYITGSALTIPIQTIEQLTYYGTGSINGTSLSLDYHSGDLEHIHGSGQK